MREESEAGMAAGRTQPMPLGGKGTPRASGHEPGNAICSWGIDAADVLIVSSSVIFVIGNQFNVAKNFRLREAEKPCFSALHSPR